MTTPTHADIVVVGAGPTGLTLASQLLRFGVQCRVVDQEQTSTAHSRAVGISARSLEVFDEFGAADELLDLGHRINVANFYSRGGLVGRLTLSAVHGTKFPFALAIPQNVTERVLRAQFMKLGGTIDTGFRVVGLDTRGGKGPVCLKLDTPHGSESIEASWVVGADGARSTVRGLLGIGMLDEPLDVSFSIVDAFVEGGPARAEGHYYFSPDGMLVVIPMPDGSYRLAATVPGAPSTDGIPDLEYVRTLVATRLPKHMEVRELRDAGWGGTRVRIRPRLAVAFRSGSCLLAGDAAHLFSPVGGQGMNGGIQDAHNLAWKLALVTRRRAPESLLDSYEAERLPVARALMKASNAQTRLATIRAPLGVKMRDLFLSLGTRTGRLDRKMVPTLTQLAVDYAGSSPVTSAVGARGGPAGRRVPDAPLKGGEGVPARVFEVLARRPFTVLALVAGPRDLAVVRELEERVLNRYAELVTVFPVRRSGSQESIELASTALDRDGILSAFINSKRSSVLLVRPDGHAAMRDDLVKWESVLTHLDMILGGEGTWTSARKSS